MKQVPHIDDPLDAVYIMLITYSYSSIVDVTSGLSSRFSKRRIRDQHRGCTTFENGRCNDIETTVAIYVQCATKCQLSRIDLPK